MKPGEHLILRVPWSVTPTQVRELQKALTAAVEYMELPFKALVLPGNELGVAEADDSDGLEVLAPADLAAETFSRGGRTWRVFACARCGARKLDFEIFQTEDGRTWCLWPDHVPAPAPEGVPGGA